MFRRAFITGFVVLAVFSIGWPVTATAATVPEIQADKGLVVFYRPKKMTGGAIRFSVNHAQGSLGTLNNGTMVFGFFEPGQSQFWSQVISQDGITVTIEPGRVYFVRADVQMGILAGRPKFTIVDEETGRTEIAKL
jgi:hypothetical protein